MLKYLYFLVAAVEIIAEATQNESLRFISKSLLMPVLVVIYFRGLSGQWNRFQQLIVAALVFSWLGDLALMWVPGNETDRLLLGLQKDANYFMVGLLSFFNSNNMFYAIAFTKSERCHGTNAHKKQGRYTFCTDFNLYAGLVVPYLTRYRQFSN